MAEKIDVAKKRFNEKKSTIDEITSAAEKMLSTGLETQNFETMQTAKTMFKEAKKQREQLNDIEKETENLSKTKGKNLL